jgi:AP-1 complex subunit beta-1
LQHIVAGQQAENLLDFEDADSSASAALNAPVGLAATADLANTPAAASLISGTSTNPLDDLVSIFGSVGFNNSLTPMSNPSSGVTSPVPGSVGGGMNGFAGLDFGMASPPPQPQIHTPLGGFARTSPTAPNGGHTNSKQSQQAQEDLLGLF